MPNPASTSPGWTARLRDVFGKPLPDVTAEQIADLVSRNVREDVDLDFKQTLYGGSDRDKHALAGDIAALANNRGGVIVLGVREDDAAAAELTPVVLSDGEEQRIKQIAAGNLIPYVPFDILRIPGAADPAEGFYLLVVPPSVNRPHAVRVDDRTLRYPRRDGTTTRWLAEPEIADLYQTRFIQIEDQVSRLEQLASAGRGGLKAPADPVITITLVPDNPGSMPISIEQMRRLQTWARAFRQTRDHAFRFLADTFANPAEVTTGVRLIRLRSRQDSHVDCYSDGAGVAVTPWRQWGMPFGVSVLAVNQLLWETIGGLLVVGRHAVENTGAYGEAVVELRLTGTSMQLHAIGPHEATPVGDARILRRPVTSRHTVSLEALTGSMTDVLLTARILLTEIMQAFGVPEVREITADGALRIQHFVDRREVEPWAGRHGVAVIEEFLNS
jgi:hypothetical protein